MTLRRRPTDGLRLFMTADAVGGVWTYALDLARGLARQGVTTTLATLGPAPGATQLAAAASVPGLALRVTTLPLDWLAASAAEIVAAGQYIARLARSSKADVIHLNSPALAAAGGFDAPVLGLCHSCLATWWAAVHGGPMPHDFRWRTDLLRDGYAAVSALAVPTHAFARATAVAHELERVPATIHNGRGYLRRSGRPPEYANIVFTAGRLWDRGKNLATLDRVAARLPIPVLAAGPLRGPEGSVFTPRHLIPLGPLGASPMASRLLTRPIFTSLALYEPFGLAVLEAAQAGCPLVLSDIPTFRELWADAALYVPAAAIRLLLVDRSERLRFGLAAQRRALRYSADAMVGKTFDLYRSLLHADGRKEQVA